ncbi:MAG: DNA-formamidopyrimidine glycosylase family protein [Jatrophihabitans sp.]|uniref:DNA-formamidopyrimidine glycosylase family protein n=1 Tax=Jatrophihabitans sp. TaxID=1932789 RepID=UPI003F7E66E8
MPEGDTVWLTAHRLHQALAGRVVTDFDLRVPQLATADLRGTTVTEVVSRGKHVLTRFDTGVTLHSHLRMDGSWYLSRAGQRPRKHPEFMIRAIVGNGEWRATGYRVHDLQLVERADEDRLVGHLGPDLLGPDWDVDLAVANLQRQPERTIGEALLDQRNLAGIGNMYKAEILFMRRTNPWTPVHGVVDLPAMVVLAQKLLRMNRDHPEQATTGLPGRGNEHWVFERVGQPCRRCRTRIVKADQGDPPYARITYWCPTCQPTADTTPPTP